jgi:hypothetical protein
MRVAISKKRAYSKMHPLIKGFKSTAIWKAFILNAITTSIAIVTTILVKSQLDKIKLRKDGTVVRVTSFKNVLISLLAGFFSALIAYGTMWLIFGYGKGMTYGY